MQSLQAEKAAVSNADWSVYWNKIYPYVGYLLLFFLLVTVLWAVMDKSRSKRTPDPSTNDSSDEYDFMSSDEAIPAKLDLARAYMTMGDHLAAKGVLEEVLARGNAEQKAHAQNLITKIPLAL